VPCARTQQANLPVCHHTPTKDGRSLWWWVGLAMLCMQGSE